MLACYCIFLLLFSTLDARAGSPSPEVVERIRTLTLDGLQHAYNFDFPGATKSFDEATNVDPMHPRPYVSKAMILFWRYLLTKNDTDLQTFRTLADRAIDAAEQFEDKYGDDAEAKLCLGTVYGYRAIAHTRTDNYFKAAWDARKSYGYFFDALQIDPQRHDAYLGIGLFHYLLSYISKPLQWIVSIMGISGDSDAGIREIRSAAQDGYYNRVEARYALAQFLPWYNGDFENSGSILADLHTQYPLNPLLTFTLGVWEIRSNNVLAAKERLEPIVSASSESFDVIRPYARYKLAECYYRLGSFERARQMYQSFLSSRHGKMYVATACYRAAVAFELAGRRDSALLYYRKASAADRTFGDDAYSARKAELRIKSPFSHRDTIFVNAQNALRSGRYEAALGLLNALKAEQDDSPEMRGEIEFCIGESYYEQQKYDQALAAYQGVASMNAGSETWLIPWSHYQGGLCLAKLSRSQEARKEFERVLEYDNYDFKNWLEFRAKREVETIAKVKSGK